MGDMAIKIAVIEDAEELREMLYDWLPIIKAARYVVEQVRAGGNALYVDELVASVEALQKLEGE